MHYHNHKGLICVFHFQQQLNSVQKILGRLQQLIKVSHYILWVMLTSGLKVLVNNPFYLSKTILFKKVLTPLLWEIKKVVKILIVFFFFHKNFF